MRLLLLAPRFHTNLYHRVRALQEAGHEVRVRCLYEGGSEYARGVDVGLLPEAVASNVLKKLVQRLSSASLRDRLSLELQHPSVLALDRELRSFAPHALIIRGYLDSFSLLAALLCRRRGIPFLQLTQTRNDTIFGYQLPLTLYLRLMESLGQRAMVAEVPWARDALRRAGGGRVVHLPFAHPPLVETGRNYPADTFRILCIGKFMRRKRHDLLLQAVAAGQFALPVQVTLVGERRDAAYLEEVQALISNDFATGGVEVRHDVPYAEMPAVYAAHDAFVLPSTAEPAAYSPFEAMALGLPVIAGTACGTSQHILDSNAGLVFEDGNVESLVACLEALVNDRERYAAMSDAAARACRERYCPKGFARAVAALLDSGERSLAAF